MRHQTITIQIFPDPAPAVVEICNPFFLTRHQCMDLKENIIEKLRDLVKEGNELHELKERLRWGMTPYGRGEYPRKKTRQSHLDAYLDYYKDVPNTRHSKVLRIHVFVLASLDSNDWGRIRKHGKEFWTWVTEELSEVAEPPIEWMNALQERLRRLDRRKMVKGKLLPDNLNNLKECKYQTRLDCK